MTSSSTTSINDVGTNSGFAVQTAVTVGSSAGSSNVTTVAAVIVHLSAEIYYNFSASATAAISTGNDLKLAAGLHTLVVPKSGTTLQYLNYQRVGGSDVTMRLVLQ